MIMKSEWERIEMNGNVIGCDIGIGFDTISAIQHWNENKWMNEWMISYLRSDWQSQDTTHNQWSVNQ